MRTNGRTSSCGGGASMTTAEPRGRVEPEVLAERGVARQQPLAGIAPAGAARRNRRAACRVQTSPKRASPCRSARRPSPSMASVTDEPLVGSSAPSRSAHSTSATPSARASSQPSSKTCSGVLEAVEVEMPEDAARRVVDLDQGEGRAGHDQRRIARGGAQDGAGQRGLADAEPALQGHDVARPAGARRARRPAARWRLRRAGTKKKSAPVLPMPTFNTCQTALRACGSISSGRGRP